MTRKLDRLHDDGSDFALVDQVFVAICKYHSDNIDVGSLCAEEQVVYLVWGAHGLIGNGGFNYLFETSLSGDPHFDRTAEAFETIGCDPASQAFRRALELFPGSCPPADVGQRVCIYRQGDGANRHAIDMQFFSAKDLDHHLAEYVRSQWGAFAHLGRGKKRRVSRTRPIRDADIDREPHAVEMLPHWARVAFAAHCAREILPLFDKYWPNAMPERQEALCRAIDLAEHSAEYGRADQGLDDAVMHAIITAGAAMRAMVGDPDMTEPVPADGNDAVSAANIAKVAEHAARAAAADRTKSALPALQALRFARGVLEEVAQTNQVAGLVSDLYDLLKLARRKRWTDSTQVPCDIFGRLHESEPAKPWWKFW